MRFGRYDWGLSDDQEARAQRLHHGSTIVDLIYWGPVTYRSYPAELEAEIREAIASMKGIAPIHTFIMQTIYEQAGPDGKLGYREAWDASGVTAGCRQVFLGDAIAPTVAAQLAHFDKHQWLVKALRADDIRRAKHEGLHAGFINTQGDCNMLLEQLDFAYLFGLRMVMLTYNTMNRIGAGCTERTDAGVSNYGAVCIRRMNELGVIVDTGHCGRQTTLDACELSGAPVVASHTSAAAVAAHERAKSDDEFRAIAGTGGVIGVVTVPFFLGTGPEVTIEAMLDHIDHIAALVGAEHIAIGTDWPMPYPRAALRKFFSAEGQAALGFRPDHGISPESNLVGFDDYRDFPNITRGLVARGYSDDQIRGILGENFLRVFEDVCG